MGCSAIVAQPFGTHSGRQGLAGTQPADVGLHRVQRLGHQVSDAQSAQDAQQILGAYTTIGRFQAPDDTA
jgi:hypothetical protein